MAPDLSQRKIKVAVLGATGTVGQRFIQQLSVHPYFVIHAIGASPRSAGKPYASVVKWKLNTPVPKDIGEMTLRECKVDEPGMSECAVIFSGLDHDVAGDIEIAFRAANLVVFSNAKNYRRDPIVPLIIPLVNPSHLSVIPHQLKQFTQPSGEPQKGYIVCNANCSTTGIAVALSALEQSFGALDTVMVTTLQAISGAGYPGVSSLDIMDNVVPYIGSEEEKIEWETAKILGGVLPDQTGFDYHQATPMKISAACNRVPVIDGHTSCVSVRFSQRPPPSIEAVLDCFENFVCEAQTLGPELVPSAPKRAIILHTAPDRPQPRLDRDLENGAAVSVGRVRSCGVLDVKFVTLLDNVRLGAATSSVMNAEIAIAKGYIEL